MNIQPHWAYDKFCIIPWGWPKTWLYHSISLDLPPYYCHFDFWSKPGRFRLTLDECHEASREFRKKIFKTPTPFGTCTSGLSPYIMSVHASSMALCESKEQRWYHAAVCMHSVYKSVANTWFPQLPVIWLWAVSFTTFFLSLRAPIVPPQSCCRS